MLYSEYGQFHHDSLGISAAATSDVDGDGVPEYSVLSFDDLHTNSGGKLYLYDGASHNQRGAISGDSLAGGTGYLGNHVSAITLPGPYPLGAVTTYQDSNGQFYIVTLMFAPSGILVLSRVATDSSVDCFGLLSRDDSASPQHFLRREYALGTTETIIYEVHTDGSIIRVGPLGTSGYGQIHPLPPSSNNEFSGDFMVEENLGSGNVQISVFNFNPILSTSRESSSANSGGNVHLDMNFPDEYAGQSYRVLLSANTGAIPFGSAVIPLDYDRYFQWILSSSSSNFFTNHAGILDAYGNANSRMQVSAGSLGNFVGRAFYFAAVTFIPGATDGKMSSIARVLNIVQ